MRVALQQMAATSGRKADIGPLTQQRVMHSESKGADAEQREPASAINGHPVANSCRNPPVKTPPPPSDENGHNFHITLISL